MQGTHTNNSHVSLKSESVWFKTKLISQFLTLSFILTQPFYLSYLHAAPVGGEVVGGTGSISQSDLTTTINQTSQNLSVDWQNFDINTNETVNFVQPNTSSIALNRILGNNGSIIQGKINANGQVILVNPNGIFFTPTATINVGGLIASSLDMMPADFMNGNYIFNEVLGADGAVINSGIINASVGGDSTGGNVALIGKQVKNDGLISANLGSVVLAVGKQSVLTFDNQGLIGVKVTTEVLQEEVGLEEAVINNGEINATGGRILLTASTSQDVFSQAVNTNSLDQASSVVVHADGSFTLGGGADVLNTGSIDVSVTDTNVTNNENTARIVLLGENVTSSGSIKADSLAGNAGEIEIHSKDKTLLIENSITSAQALSAGKGGLIKFLGNKVGLFNQSIVDASGVNGGGEVLIGGDRQGLNSSIRNSDFIYLGENTSVYADATENGDGGKIITFAKDTARIHANLYARGGSQSGNGGFIETSGLRGFEISKAPDVSAINGNGGLWLIDPYNITIVNDAAAIPTSTNIFESTSGGTDVFTSNGNSADLEVGLIEQSLLTQNVEITTGTGATTEFGDISFQADLVFDINGGAGGSTNILTLNADRDITFTNTSSITSTTNDGLNLILNAGRNISLSSDAVDPSGFNGINLQGGDFDLNSAGTVTFNAGTIDTGGGNIDITNSNIVYFNGATILTAGGDFDITNNSTEVTSSLASTIITSGGNLTVSNTVDLNFGNVNIDVAAGDIDLDGATGVVTLGNITETGGGSDFDIRNAASIVQENGTTVQVADNGRFGNASTTSITLDETGNNFSSLLLKGGSATINDSGAAGLILVGGTSLTTLLDITAGGDITDSGVINVSNGGAAITNFDTTGLVTIDGGNDNFDQVNFINASSVDVTDSEGGIAIAANDGTAQGGGVTGNLTIRAINGGSGLGADITTYGEINAGAGATTTATFTVDDSQSIFLNNANNTFGGDISFSTGGTINNIDITDDTALTLPSINITGNLNVIGDIIQFDNTTVGGLLTATTTSATLGDITQIAGTLNITGTSIFDATRDVILGFSGNNFRDTVAVVKARNATFKDITGIHLGKISISGNLNVTSDSNNSSKTQHITQVATAGEGISVAGTSTFIAGDNNVILTNTDNDFNLANSTTGTGAVSVTANIAQITDTNSLDLANASLSTDSAEESIFTAAAGDITQFAGSFVNDRGTGSVSRFDANGGNITLNSTTNNFQVVRVDSATNASFTDLDTITLGNINTTGNLSIVAGQTGGSGTRIQNINNATISVGGTLNLTSRTSGGNNRDILLDSSNADYNNINIINARHVDIADNTDSVSIQGTVTGDLSLASNGSFATNVITNSGALFVSGNADFAANDNQSIDLSNSANSFSNDPDFTANSGRLNNISITDITALQLQDNLDIRGDLVANASTVTLQNTSTGGNLDLTATTTINQAGGKSITVAGVSTLNGTLIDFSNTGNDFQSDVTVTNAAASVSLRDDTNGIILGSLANAFTSANLTVESNGGDLTQNNSITTGVTTLDAGSSDVLLNTNSSNDFTAGVTITAAQDVFISDMNILNIEDSNTSRDLNVTASAALSFGASSSSEINVGRNLTFDAGGAVTQAANSTITVAGDSQMSSNAGTTDFNIILNSANNNFNAVNIIAAAVVNLRDSTNFIDIGGNVSGNLTVRADDTFFTGNIIRNSTALNVGGNSVFTAANDKSIDLSNTSNVFTGTINFTNSLQNLNLYDNSALTLQNNLLVNNDLTVSANSLRFNTTTVNGDLSATTTTGLMNQILTTGIQVSGTATLDGGTGGINLRGLNDFNGAVSLQTTSTDTINNPSNVIINDVLNDFELGTSNIQGGLSVTANSISQVDATMVNDGISVANLASFIAASDSEISLMNSDNNFNSISFSASTGALRNISINNSGDLTLGSINVTNNLTAISGGDIFNNGQLIVGALTTVDANDITLNTLSNNLNNITVTGNNVSVNDTNIINFSGDSVVTGDLMINAGTSITDDNNSQILATTGVSSLNVGNNTNNTITLDSPRHDFNEVRVVAGGDVTISDVNGFNIGTSNVGSNLYLIADSDNDDIISNITNTGGAISVNGFTDITTSSGSSISLNNSANDFGGYLTFNETGSTPLGSIDISNTNITTLDNVNSSNLTVTSTGTSQQNIQQTASSTITVTNNTTLSSGTASIVLDTDTATNDLSLLNVTSANNVNVTDVNTLTIGSINATGTVIINSNGLTLGEISAGTITLDSGISSITDGNGTNINITSTGAVTLNATGGIGSSSPLDLAMNGTYASLTAINDGSGNIGLINSGNITLEEIKNNVNGGAFSLENTGDVRIKSLIIDRSSDLATATFNVRSGSVLGIQGAVDSNGEKVHVSANTAIFNMNNTGTVGQLGQTLIAKVPNKIEVIASNGTYIEYFGQVPPREFIGDNAYKNRALQAIESLSGQQLIEIESLAEIDPAIFTDVRNYSHSDIALMMPSDQRYTDDEEEDEEAKEKRQNFLKATP